MELSLLPEAYVSTMSKAKRRGKIFVDYFRNDYAATAIADFVTLSMLWDQGMKEVGIP